MKTILTCLFIVFPTLAHAAQTQGDPVAGMLLLGVLIGGYLFPGLVATFRSHHNEGAIWLTTLLFGWTVLGWAIALIWACTAVRKEMTSSS